MALSQIASGTYLPTALTTLTTLFTDTTVGLKKFWINLRNLPAGTVLNLSFQSIVVSGGSYDEFRNVTLSVPVAIPAAPGVGYEPWQAFEWDDDINGLQVQAQIISGPLPTTGLQWAENGVS